jgi:hypothetical protein
VTKKKQAPAKKPKRLLYVEGGGDHNTILANECRRAFTQMFDKAGIAEKPSVRPEGGREQAYRAFCNELKCWDNHAWLLVDAEELAPALKPGDTADPWEHVKARQGDKWVRPSSATDGQLHLMNVNMETWLLCDRKALRDQFPKINLAKLPTANSLLETKHKEAVYRALANALKDTPSGKYSKSNHSFKILAAIDPLILRRTLFWADRFLLAMGAPPLPGGSASMAAAPAPTP